jgi:hypothetical protein
MSSSKKAQQEALAAFRKKHFKEMEINLKVAKSIRDNVKEAAKNRNEAVKIISRMLGSLVPEKIEPKTKATPTDKQKQLTAKEKAEVDSLLKA